MCKNLYNYLLFCDTKSFKVVKSATELVISLDFGTVKYIKAVDVFTNSTYLFINNKLVKKLCKYESGLYFYCLCLTTLFKIYNDYLPHYTFYQFIFTEEEYSAH